nr:hypothetical protein [Cnaphalocrocis medinalis granulovirus]
MTSSILKLSDFLDVDTSKKFNRSIYCSSQGKQFINRLFHIVNVINTDNFYYTPLGFEYNNKNSFFLRDVEPDYDYSEDDESIYREYIEKKREPIIICHYIGSPIMDGECYEEIKNLDEIDLRKYNVKKTNEENWPHIKLQFWQVIALLNCCNVSTLKELKWCGYRALLTVLIYNSKKYYSDAANQWWLTRDNFHMFTVYSIKKSEVMLTDNIDHIIGFSSTNQGVILMNELPYYFLPHSYFKESQNFRIIYKYVLYLWYRFCDYYKFENRFFQQIDFINDVIVSRCEKLTKLICYENQTKLLYTIDSPHEYIPLLKHLEKTIDYPYYCIDFSISLLSKVNSIITAWNNIHNYTHDNKLMFKYICENQYKKL